MLDSRSNKELHATNSIKRFIERLTIPLFMNILQVFDDLAAEKVHLENVDP